MRSTRFDLLRAVLRLWRAALALLEVMLHGSIGRNNLESGTVPVPKLRQAVLYKHDGRSPLDLDFGCPYGCDDNGRHIRDIRTEIKGVLERGG
jgi:hypothetical protein